jgi:hypothetical protein
MRLAHVTCLLCLLFTLPSWAQQLDASARDVPILAIEVSGSWARMAYPEAVLFRDEARDTPLVSVARRASVPRVSVGANFNLERLVGVAGLWETNAMDWHLAGKVEAFVLRAGLEKRFLLSQRLQLSLGVFGGAADVSVATGRYNYSEVPEGTTPPPFVLGFERTELRAHQWLPGVGATMALHVPFGSRVYARAQAGYSLYFQQARRFVLGADTYTFPDFAVSLSGPQAGLLLGVHI